MRDRAVAFLIVIALSGAVFTPCRATVPASLQGVSEAVGENGQGGSDPVSSGVVNQRSTPSNPVLTARCPCGCNERLAVPGSATGLGVALISRAPSPAPLPGDQELCSVISFLPTSPLSGIDTVPRSA